MNAAVWLGATVFFTVAAGPAFNSQGMQHVLGAGNFPYFSRAIAEVVLTRYYYFQIVCGVIALLHLLARRLYQAKTGRPSAGLAVALLTLVLIGGTALEPRLQKLHVASYARNFQPAQREAAAKSFHAWRTVARVLNLVTLAGLAVYFWQTVNPADPTRFVHSVKFRG